MDRKRFVLLAVLCLGLGVFTVGCGSSNLMPDTSEEMQADSEDGLGLIQQFLPQEDSFAPILEMQYASREAYPQLAAFLADYFAVAEELLGETRYYYCYVDLNDDGVSELAAVVLNEELEDSSGHPLLLLRADGDTFTVLDEIDHIHTPVIIDDACTNGWHNVIPNVYGGKTSPGFLIYRYDGQHYSADEEEDFVEELTGMSGISILSDNFIDDLDKGEYMTLLP